MMCICTSVPLQHLFSTQASTLHVESRHFIFLNALFNETYQTVEDQVESSRDVRGSGLVEAELVFANEPNELSHYNIPHRAAVALCQR